MNELPVRVNGTKDIQAWDGSKATEPPASRFTAARLVTGHVGAVAAAAARGNLAVSIDDSGLLIARVFDDPGRIVFSCRLREEEGTGIDLIGPEESPLIFAAWRSGMALFESSGEGFELRAEAAFEESASAMCVILSGTRIYASFNGSTSIRLGSVELREGARPLIELSGPSVELPGDAAPRRFRVGPGGEIACRAKNNTELFLVEADGRLRWRRAFSGKIWAAGFDISPDGASVAVCDGPFVRELDAKTGRDRQRRPAFEDLKHRPVRLAYAGPDKAAVGAYQTVALLERGKDGELGTKFASGWLVSSDIQAICRSGRRFLFCHENTLVSCADGDHPYAYAVGSPDSGTLLSLSFQGKRLRIADASGRAKSLELSDLSASVGPRRERKDIFSAPGWTEWLLHFYRCRGRSYSLWSNSLEDDEVGSSLEFKERLLRCAAFSDDLGLAAVGDSDGRVSIYRCAKGLGGELCTFDAPSDEIGAGVANLLFLARGKQDFLVCVTRGGRVARYRLGAEGKIAGKALLARISKESESDLVSMNTIAEVEGGFGVGVQSTKESIQFFSIDDLSELHPPISLGGTAFTIEIVGGSLNGGSALGEMHEFGLDALRERPRRTKNVTLGGIRGISMPEDGKLLAVGGADYCVRILDASSWEELARVHLFDRDMIVTTPPTEEDRAKGREFHAFYNPLKPDPTDDPLFAFYHSKGEEIRSGTGVKLDPSKAEDRARIAEYLETLYGTEAIASGDYGRRMILDAIWRPARAAAAIGHENSEGGRAGTGRVAGLIESGEA